MRNIAPMRWISRPRSSRGAVGGRGPNPEYLFKTADMLRDLGIPDPQLDYLAKTVANLTKSA